MDILKAEIARKRKLIDDKDLIDVSGSDSILCVPHALAS